MQRPPTSPLNSRVGNKARVGNFTGKVGAVPGRRIRCLPFPFVSLVPLVLIFYSCLNLHSLHFFFLSTRSRWPLSTLLQSVFYQRFSHSVPFSRLFIFPNLSLRQMRHILSTSMPTGSMGVSSFEAVARLPASSRYWRHPRIWRGDSRWFAAGMGMAP